MRPLASLIDPKRSRLGVRAVAIAMAITASLGARAANAYCRASACGSSDTTGSIPGQVCNPPTGGDCGVALQWRQPCIGFNVAQAGSKQIDYATAEQTLIKAFTTWGQVDCGGGPPSIVIFDLGSVPCAAAEYNQHAGNANILVFRDDMWPHDAGGGGVDTLALTTVTYNVESGDIYDADIEVNTADNIFTTTNTPGPGDVDLLSVLTHETGHFLGLAHSQLADTTMYPSYTSGISMRVLADDDKTAICVAYPYGRTATGECTGLPRHGFASECGADQTYVSCAASSARYAGGERPAVAVAIAIAAALAVRSRSLKGRRGSRRS